MSSTETDVIDSVSGSTAIKAPVRGATTANITLSGEQTVDGLALVSGDLELVKDQTDTTENGIYVVSASAWSRAANFDGNRDVRQGTLVNVYAGTTNLKTMWRCTTANPIVIGTSNIVFEQFLGTLSNATTETAGVVKLSTDAIGITATDTERAMTPANVRAAEATNFVAAVAAATAKTTPVAADILAILDSAASNALKRSTIQQVITALSLFSSVNIQAFTTPGANTYTPTSGMKYCIAISTGGGGGGGGADTDGSGSAVGAAAGGGSAPTCIELFTAAQIGVSQTVTIGAAGTAGSATAGTNGGNGGDTTFGALHTAGGGVGGTGSGTSAASASNNDGGAAGTATGGLVNIPGAQGGSGMARAIDGTSDTLLLHAGHGAASFWGGGGRGRVFADSNLSGANNIAGVNGGAYGSGGSGAICSASTTGAAGGTGAAGISIVIEFM